jgi:GT2 family glycosyltransferase
LKLLIITVNHKVTGLTIDCLQSLAGEICGLAGAKVAVVENGSGDDAAERIRQAIAAHAWDPWVDLIPISVNLGFSGANNLAIRKAMASANPPEYVLLLNPDTIVQPGSIAALVRFMDERPEVGIAGSRLEYPDGRAQGTPFRFQGIASEFDRGRA